MSSPVDGKSNEWISVLAEDELEKGDVTAVKAGNQQIAIYDHPQGLYATSGLCTHAGAMLCDGYLDGFVIECPLHQGGFDIRTGEALYPPVTKALLCYPVRRHNGRIQLQAIPRSFDVRSNTGSLFKRFRAKLVMALGRLGDRRTGS